MRTPSRPLPRFFLAIVMVVLVAPTVAACGGSASQPEWTAGPAPVHTPTQHAAQTPAEAAWAARPAYVRSHPVIEEAYAYALARPDALDWLPCYCGCVAMDHRSNLDCFFKPTMDGLEPVFEEHASYCDICVETALMAKQMLGEGHSLREVRDRVDAMFGGRAPGTDTAYPPA
jgi:hypothetical protein